MKYSFGLALFAVIATVLPAQAQVCRVGCNQVVHQPVQQVATTTTIVQNEYVPYAVPVAYPAVAVPIYSYINGAAVAYQQGVQAVPQQQAAVATQQQQQVDQADAFAEKVADIIGRKYNLTANQGARQVGPPSVLRHNGQTPQVFTKECTMCHTRKAADGQGGGYAFFEDDGSVIATLTREDRMDIFDAVYTNRMPKNSKPLDDEFVEDIRKWAFKKGK